MKAGFFLLSILMATLPLAADPICPKCGRPRNTRPEMSYRCRNFYWQRYPYYYSAHDEDANWPSKRETQLYDYLTR